MIPSPSNYIPLAKEMSPLFRNRETWTDIVATQKEKNVELQLAEEAYIPARISDFILTPKSYFNVYIRIGASTFIKILNAGDSLQLNTIHYYVKKGVTHFFISAEEQRKYICLCEELSHKIVKRTDVALVKKAKSVLRLGASISQNIMHTEITDEKLDFANNFLNQTVTLIKSMRMQNTSLKKFLESIEMKEHPSSVSFLAGIIANEAGFESSRSVKLAGVEALVHDIGLFDLDRNFSHESLYTMTEEKQALFDKHEKHGSEILRNNGGFEEVICQAVEQHHMRRRGNDPARRTNNINLVTEIVGAADELHNLISSDEFSPDKIRWFMGNTLPNFSPQIEKAVIKLLNKKSAA
jgi:HD-GYP domain-containing protein (c-di-GMP phosphodiesterase class II)